MMLERLLPYDQIVQKLQNYQFLEFCACVFLKQIATGSRY